MPDDVEPPLGEAPCEGHGGLAHRAVGADGTETIHRPVGQSRGVGVGQQGIELRNHLTNVPAAHHDGRRGAVAVGAAPGIR